MTAGKVVLSLAASCYRLDLIHDPNGIAPFLGPRMRARRIVTVHDAFPYIHPDSHNKLDNWRYRHQLPAAAQRADAVITVSACSQHDLISYLGLSAERVHIIAEGVNPRFRPIADSASRQALLSQHGIQPPYLLYVGGINARKNIARLCEAYARVRERHPNLKLVLAGKRQWQVGEIDLTLRRLSLGESVRFTGYMDEAHLPALYSAAELFIFPSLYEGFGLPPLEAMACGTPVVTSNTSSLPEVVGNAALLADPSDVASLAAVMEKALGDEALRAELRRRGLERAAHFTWERAARDTLRVYEQVWAQAPIESLPAPAR